MHRSPLRHNGDGHSGQILASTTDEGFVRLEILPMNDKPYIDMTVTQLMQYANTIKIKVQMGEM